MPAATVALHGLSVGYRSRQGLRTVAAGLCAEIRPCRLTCLLGENGAGKSTLLRTLSGFLPPLAGEVTIGGRRLSSYSDRELARTVGVVLTERPDVRLMTAAELVAMGRQPYTGFWGTLTNADRALAREAMQQVGIEGLAGRLVSTLSDGERQKVMIAKALAQQTPVIFLDEPTAFLDYPSKADVLLLLRRIARLDGKTVFLSTHDLELALQVADEVWLLERGGALHTGTPRQLAEEGWLARFAERGTGGVRFEADTLTVRLEAGLPPSGQ